MRVLSTILAALAVTSGALAADSFKTVIVSFPKEISQKIVDEAKAKFVEQGGEITHVYRLINGFSGKVPQTMTQSLSTWSAEYSATVEDDQVVSAYDDGSS